MPTSVKETNDERLYLVIAPAPYVNNVLKNSTAFSKYVLPTKIQLTTLTLVFFDI